MVFIGFFAVVAVLLILAYIWKSISQAREEREEREEALKAPIVAAPTAPVAIQAQTVQEAGEDLIAVLTAAVVAISGSTCIQILKIEQGGQAWVLSGRQELMTGL